MKKPAIRRRTTRATASDCVLVGVLAVMVTYAMIDGLLRVAVPLGA
jgi:hypothetical protein